MQLAWRIHNNPIVDANLNLYLDLSGRYKLRTARFETTIDGGFGAGTVEIQNPTEEDARAARHWFMKWLRVTDARGGIAYEGLVAEIHAQVGYHQYVLAIDQFANRLYAEYQWAGSYVGVGKCPKGKTCKGRAVSLEGDVATTDTASAWGIKEAWIDLTDRGVLSPTTANDVGDKELLKRLNAHAVNLTPEEETPAPSIQLVLWGPYQTLTFRRQSRKYVTETEIATIISGGLTTGSKAQYINTSDLSGLEPTGRSMTYNADGRPIWLKDYIHGAVTAGNSNGRDVYFQVWENRKPFLATRGAGVSFVSRSDDPRVYRVNRAFVPAYRVRAGGLLLAENADVGIDNYSDALQRPYVSLIESTTYDDIAERLTIPTGDDTTITHERLLAKLWNDYRANL